MVMNYDKGPDPTCGVCVHWSEGSDFKLHGHCMLTRRRQYYSDPKCEEYVDKPGTPFKNTGGRKHHPNMGWHHRSCKCYACEVARRQEKEVRMKHDPCIEVTCDNEYCCADTFVPLTSTARGGYDERHVDSELKYQKWIITEDEKTYCSEDCKKVAEDQ